jgi:hypothetical protein
MTKWEAEIAVVKRAGGTKSAYGDIDNYWRAGQDGRNGMEKLCMA